MTLAARQLCLVLPQDFPFSHGLHSRLLYVFRSCTTVAVRHRHLLPHERTNNKPVGARYDPVVVVMLAQHH